MYYQQQKDEKSAQLFLSIDRNVMHWEIDDVTTALFRFKSTTNNGVTEVRENFGERYTEPSE